LDSTHLPEQTMSRNLPARAIFPCMIQLFDASTGAQVGTISEAQLKFLTSQLEEESGEDQDYYINTDTLDMFQEKSADAGLVDVLRAALGSREDMEIRWSK